jgi:dienelactone hydrolase
MVEAKTRRFAPAFALLAGIALSGCEVSQDGEEFPPPASEDFIAYFYDLTGAGAPLLPWPTDLFFAGSTDGTINIPAALIGVPGYTPWGAAINTLDGYSTSAPMYTGFSQTIEASTLTAANIRIVEMYLSNTTKAPAQGAELPSGVASPVIRVLTFGTDYSASVSAAVDGGGKTLQLTPLKPLKPSTGATNIGYLVLLSNGIHDINGNAAQPSSLYSAIKAAPANCSTLTDATQNAICRLTKAHLSIGQAVGMDPANVVLTWSFSTQSVDDTLGALAALVPAQPITVQATGFNTFQADARLQGKADIYVGTTVMPYYHAVPASPSDRVILTGSWTAAGPSPVPGLDPASRNLTRFNPVPLKTADLTIPVLVTVPNAAAAGGVCAKPAAGWPVAIVQHGLRGDRTQALAMADSFADACFVVASIDQPLHGITSTTNPFYQAGNERTFNVDLINNTTSATGPDGVTDISGVHWLNLSSALTFRDNLRQGQADLVVFAKSVANMDLTGDAVSDVDPTRIHYVGLSLGGLMGSVFVKFSPNTRTATLAAPGGPLTQWGLQSPTFRPTIVAGLARSGIVENSSIFQNFFRDAQTVIDSGDPLNHIAGTQARVPTHLIKVNGDTVTPNATTDNLIRAAPLTKIKTLGPNPVGPGTGGYVAFTQGSHGSLFDPGASPTATVEMQKQSVLFAFTATQPGGPFVVLTDMTVIEQ